METNILTAHWRSPRHRCAMKRHKLSAPLALAIAKGIITPEQTIFDYGTGRGDNIRLLTQKGYQATGFDPHYYPDTPKQRADIVALCYVLGVIEDPLERREVLEEAWSLANKTLLVAAQVQHSRGKIPHGDGFLTKWSTFEVYMNEPTWRKYVEEITGIKARRIGKGILVLSKPIVEELVAA